MFGSYVCANSFARTRARSQRFRGRHEDFRRRTRAVAKLRRTLARLGNRAGLSREAQLVFAIWLLVAALIARSGPRDADVSLDLLAKRLRE